MMLEIKSSVNQRPVPPRTPDTPEVMQAFVSRHFSVLVLAAVLVAQFLFAGFQETRGHKVRLIKVWAVAAFDPFDRSVRGLSDITSAAFHSFGDSASVERENGELLRQLSEARAESRELAEAGAENARLRALLDLEPRLPLRTVSAAVIAASPGAGSAIYIDRGAKDGLSADLAVVTPDGVVGKTVAVFRDTAQVLLITDASSGAGAQLEKARDEGVLKGSGDGLCALDYIPNSTAVAPGDQVVTSGLDQIYPKGLLLGVVASGRGGNVYKTISVRTAVDMDRLEYVLVILRGKSSRNEPGQPGVRSGANAMPRPH
ncbi:MAG: rod shape-determining protein MreC [Terriglobia bacterium]